MAQQEYFVVLPYVLQKSSPVTVLYRLMGGELFRLWDEKCSPKIVSVCYDSNDVIALLPDGTLQVYRGRETETANMRIPAYGEQEVSAVVINKHSPEVFYTHAGNVVRVLVKDNLRIDISPGEVLSSPLSVTRSGKTIGKFLPRKGSVTWAVFDGEISPLPARVWVFNFAPRFPHWTKEDVDNRPSASQARYRIQAFDRDLGEIITTGEKANVPCVYATVEENAAVVSFPFVGDRFVTAIYNGDAIPVCAHAVNAVQAHIEFCSSPRCERYYFYVASWGEREIHVLDNTGNYRHSYILGKNGIEKRVVEALQESNDINRALRRREKIAVTKTNQWLVLAALYAAPDYPYAEEIRGRCCGSPITMPNSVSLTRLPIG